MSSMLEQAVIDATTLKEAATKNAENIILEKYSNELKDAIEALLEGPEDADLLGGLGDAGNSTVEDPMAKKLPMAATDGEKLCQCPEGDEEIEINFNQLAKQMNGGDETDLSNTDQNQLPGQMGELKPSDEENIMQEDSSEGIIVPAQLGHSLHQYYLSMGDPIYKVGSLAYSNKPVPPALIQQAVSGLQQVSGQVGDEKDKQEIGNLINQLQQLSKPKDEMSLPEGDYDQNLYENLTEETLTAMLETLEVDVKNVPLGHGGRATEAERSEALGVELARQQDTRVKDEHEMLQKAFEKLQESHKLLTDKMNVLNEEYNTIKNIAINAGNKLNQLNLANAKLIYENNALKSVSLNERQRKTIVDAISKVKTVNEAKAVYETLKESIGNQVKKSPETIKEALAMKGNTLAVINRNGKTESHHPEKDKWQRLAGIK